MNIGQILSELRQELEDVNQAIRCLEWLTGSRHEPIDRTGRPAVRLRVPASASSAKDQNAVASGARP